MVAPLKKICGELPRMGCLVKKGGLKNPPCYYKTPFLKEAAFKTI